MWRLVFVLAVGCVPHERIVALADLSDAELDIRATPAGTDITVSLRDGVHRYVEGCLVIEDRVSATLDGVALEVMDRGSYIEPAATDAASGCHTPTFHATTTALATATPSQIIVTDGSFTIEADAMWLRANRLMAVSGTIHPSAIATLTWSVASDVLDPHAGVAWTPDAGIGAGFALGHAYGSSGVTIDHNRLQLAVPNDAPSGSGTFSFSDFVSPAVPGCHQIASCIAEPLTPAPVVSAITPLM